MLTKLARFQMLNGLTCPGATILHSAAMEYSQCFGQCLYRPYLLGPVLYFRCSSIFFLLKGTCTSFMMIISNLRKLLTYSNDLHDNLSLVNLLLRGGILSTAHCFSFYLKIFCISLVVLHCDIQMQDADYYIMQKRTKI